MIDEEGMLFVTLAKGVPAGGTALDEAFLRRIAAMRFGAIRGSRQRRRRLRFKSVEELADAIRPQCLPGGYYRDPSGAVLPLTLADIDRIDSNGYYEHGNVRLLLHGLNMLRGNAQGDALLVETLANLKKWFDFSILDSYGDVGLPGAGTVAVFFAEAAVEEDELEAWNEDGEDDEDEEEDDQEGEEDDQEGQEKDELDDEGEQAEKEDEEDELHSD
ncbi:hypothetical protein BDZ90DRAFT_91689 [Jaminaea rosea]|uniref:Uncharacterized protein n=1 Tax=Jaminaea rosea TaxID=1569628 RepID=A0A316UJG0_9BASI|nr:hypothetical protein BDZ90DRAFT_91689 [Jaminaea rosea]PWN25008.1 hypothetical protein BDZ90DRAFT_91689 [Jaminaea rosea]